MVEKSRIRCHSLKSTPFSNETLLHPKIDEIVEFSSIKAVEVKALTVFKELNIVDFAFKELNIVVWLSRSGVKTGKDH